MTDCERKRAARDFLAVYAHGTQPSAAYSDILNGRQKADFAAKLNNPLAQLYDNFAQIIRADMWLCFGENFLGSAKFREFFEYARAKRVVNPRCQLAVRESSRAALAELNVCGGVKPAAVPVGFYSLYSDRKSTRLNSSH